MCVFFKRSFWCLYLGTAYDIHSLCMRACFCSENCASIDWNMIIKNRKKMLTVAKTTFLIRTTCLGGPENRKSVLDSNSVSQINWLLLRRFRVVIYHHLNLMPNYLINWLWVMVFIRCLRIDFNRHCWRVWTLIADAVRKYKKISVFK
jgi:hypothetical protein